MGKSTERETKTTSIEVRSKWRWDESASHAVNDGSDLSHGPANRPSRSSFPHGAPPCRIYRPARSPMQSALAGKRPWLLEFERAGRQWIEPLMGWTATEDPFAPLRLSFPFRTAAIDYAKRQGLEYRVIDPPERRIAPKRYLQAIPASHAQRRPCVEETGSRQNRKEKTDVGLEIPRTLGTEIACPGEA